MLGIIEIISSAIVLGLFMLGALGAIYWVYRDLK